MQIGGTTGDRRSLGYDMRQNSDELYLETNVSTTRVLG